jgi:hypothetical protein
MKLVRTLIAGAILFPIGALAADSVEVDYDQGRTEELG